MSLKLIGFLLRRRNGDRPIRYSLILTLTLALKSLATLQSVNKPCNTVKIIDEKMAGAEDQITHVSVALPALTIEANASIEYWNWL